MYKNTLLAAALVLASAFSSLNSDQAVYAQTDPNTTNPQIKVGDNTGAGATADAADFNWWWILPLLAVPVLFLLLMPRDRTDHHHGHTETLGYKGGRATREDELDEREQNAHRDEY